MSAWFPRWSPDGSRYTHEGPGKWQAQWLDADTEIWHNGVHLVIAGGETAYPAVSILTAGGGKWAGYLATNPVVIYRSWNVPLRVAGSPALNPDGRFAYTDDDQAAVKGLILDGVEIARGGIQEIRLSRQLLVWSDRERTFAYQLDGFGRVLNITVAPVEFRPIPIDTPSGPWVLTQTHTGVFVRPLTERFGYRLDNGGEAYYADAIYKHGAIHVLFTDHSGVLTEQVWPLSAPRVDVSHVQPDDDPEEDDSMPVKWPLAPNKKAIVQLAMDAHPEIDLGDEQDRARILPHIIKALGGKPWGRKATNKERTKFNSDAIAFLRPDDKFEIIDVIANGKAAWITAKSKTPTTQGSNGWWAEQPDLDDLPDPNPPDDDPDPTSTEWAVALALLASEVAQLRAEIQQALADLKTLKEMPVAPLPPIRVTGRTQSTWSHSHAIDLPVVPE